MAVAVLSAAALVAPAGASAAVVDRFSFLHVAGDAVGQGPARIADEQGRTVLLRGVAVNGLEDYYANSATPEVAPYPITPASYSGGLCPARDPSVESIPVCGLDAGQLASLGYDAVRLGVSWSALEPQPNRISSTYLDRVAQVVSWLKDQGIYTIIDMHQDAWSKYLYTHPGDSCPPPLDPVSGSHESDGAPDWASLHATPVCQRAAREIDPAVAEDFEKLWLDAPAPDGNGLQEHFAGAVAALAQRFASDPAVAGYDLFNEPSPGYEPATAMDTTRLMPFYAKIVATVRTTVPSFRQLVFLEPDVLRDVTAARDAFAPWSAFSPYPNAVWAPHIYTHVFTPDAAANAPALAPAFTVEQGYRAAVDDAKALGLPFWNGEFGADVADDETTLRQHYDNLDSFVAGGALWVWKADAWSANDGFSVMHGPFGAPTGGVAFPSRIKFTDRAYPIYTAGTLRSAAYDPDTGGFSVHGSSGPVAAGDVASATAVYVPAGDSACAVAVDGGASDVTWLSGGARLVHAYPAGGRYSIRGRC